MVAVTIAIVVLSSAGTVGWVFLSIRRQNRRLHALPRTPIRDLVAGSKVRIIGTARSLGHDVGAHFTGTTCLACHSWISSTTSDSTNQPPPPADRVVPFKVEDDTGTIEIGVERVALSLSGTSVDMTTNSHAFGASIIAREGGSVGTHYEDILPLDGRVAVIGYVVRADNGSYRLTGKPREPLVIANVVAAFVD